jgi:hypothetical protein
MLLDHQMRSLVVALTLIMAPATAAAGAQPEDEDDTSGSVTDPDQDQPDDSDVADGDGTSTPEPTDPPPPSPPKVESGVLGRLTSTIDTASTSQAVTESTADQLGFAFGSYGRIGVGTDLRGATPEATNVVHKGSRIVENSYTEADLYYRMRNDKGVGIKTVTTLAFADEPFHYTGEFDTNLALRNLYAEATWQSGLAIWIGSRMYRGDDIYLLDYWPLDDINTVGGGVTYSKERLYGAVHVGANRLLDPFQYQERQVTDPEFGSTYIVDLDRQHMVASATSSYRLIEPSAGGLGAKAKLHHEVHALPDGSRLREDETREELPSDFGWSLGAQLGLWGFADGLSHANLFVRYSQGLAAFDELQLPEGFDASKKTFPDASELVVAVSANYELGNRGGAMLGGYARRFVDADPNQADRDDGWEYIVDVRPHYAIAGDVEAAIDLSYQARFPRGLSPTMLIALDPAVVQIAPMLIYSPFGAGAYARPHFRLLYRAAHLNEGARDLYPLDDTRRSRSWVHYLGIQAEWWFNSSYR